MDATPTAKVLDQLRRRTEAREQAADAAGLWNLYIAAMQGADMVEAAYNRVVAEQTTSKQAATTNGKATATTPRPPAPTNLGAKVTPQVPTSVSEDLAAIAAEHEPTSPDPETIEAEQRRSYEERTRVGYISAETSDLFRYVIEQGGIRPSSDDLREEYREIPPTYRRPDGMPGDEMADQLATDRPELGITSERDLLEFFATRRRQARHARAESNGRVIVAAGYGPN